MTALSGVWAASLTPLDSDLMPDADRMATHIGRLLADGCDGVVVFGTTGEAASFSVLERIRFLDQLIERGVDPSTLIIGVGCSAVTETTELTLSAAKHRVAAVLMLPPFYFKAVTDDDLAGAFSWVLDGTGSVPVLLYSFPQVAGVTLSPELAGRLMNDYPGRVVGIKDSSGDLASLRAFLEAMPGGAVFPGTEVLLHPGIDEGAVGTISAMANITGPAIRAAYETPGADTVEPLIRDRDALAQFPLVPALKAVTARRLDDPQWAAVRPPLRMLDPAVASSLPVE
ncbi:MAG: dihydrodipicolinate synthase family protein [Acidimicrobiia bacterium]|nr:dihydrodipicolinate synthase family protein [Acidimicrobiia bacterium]NNL68759.1 dihydrodipicolinate synthase family protein [Acidimicrobiia bacterium]